MSGEDGKTLIQIINPITAATLPAGIFAPSVGGHVNDGLSCRN
jgi:hypothetical protein